MRKIISFVFVIIGLFSFGQHPCAIHKQASYQHFQPKKQKSLAELDNYDVHYVKLDLNMDNLSTDINGTATLGATITAPILNRFVVELHPDLTVTGATVNGVQNMVVERLGNEVIVNLTTILNQGDEIVVIISYEGTPPPGNGFNSDTGIFNDFSPTWGAQVTWTLSQPFGAYTWWPCKQVLTDKIDSVDVIVTVPENLKVGSNGVLVNEIPLPATARTRFEWESRNPIDFYLISLAIGPYIEYSYKVKPVTSPDSILIQNYIYDNPQTLPNFITDIDETGDMMLFFSNIYGNYPFWDEKYGHSMAPLSGGMEHQTMTTQGFFTRWLTAHELGHQWFGDNVTCADWSHIWVNEGFASYSEYLFEESIDYNSAQNEMAQVHGDIMSQPGGSVFVPDITDAGRIFSGRLTYNKGSAIIHSIRHWMGDPLFFESLQIYQNIFKDSTATAEDYKAVLEGLSALDFTNFFDHWYYGEGFPYISLEYNETPDGLVMEITQEGSVPAVTPFFETVLEVRLNFTAGGDTTLRLVNSVNGQHYLRDISEPIASIDIDPNNWIINQVGTIGKNIDLVYDSLASGINELDVEIVMYPNPVEDNLFIEMEANETVYADVYGIRGDLVGHFELPNGKGNISTENWSKGVYTVMLTSGVDVFTRKILK